MINMSCIFLFIYFFPAKPLFKFCNQIESHSIVSSHGEVFNVKIIQFNEKFIKEINKHFNQVLINPKINNISWNTIQYWYIRGKYIATSISLFSQFYAKIYKNSLNREDN